MYNIQLNESLTKLIVQAINNNEEDFLNNAEPIPGGDDRITFKIYRDITKDETLLPIPVQQLKGLNASIKGKLPNYIGISNVKFK